MTADGDIPGFLAWVAACSTTILIGAVVGIVWAAGRRRR